MSILDDTTAILLRDNLLEITTYVSKKENAIYSVALNTKAIEPFCSYIIDNTNGTKIFEAFPYEKNKEVFISITYRNKHINIPYKKGKLLDNPRVTKIVCN